MAQNGPNNPPHDQSQQSPYKPEAKPFIENPDGSLTRVPYFIPDSPPSEDRGNPYSALSRDVPINKEKQTWARVYVPKNIPGDGNSTKMPLIVYFHGGGFVLFSAASSIMQKFCAELTGQIPAVVVSVDYRLAPEHRLPAAYDDGLEALCWIETVEDEWVRKYADLSRCFVMGSSAGGNVAYHVGLQAATHVNQIKIRGLILHQPFFGGVHRTQSETKLIDDKVLPLRLTDIMWDLALPAGANRDHEYCNFETTSSYYKESDFERVKEGKCRVMVAGCDGDPLVDRQRRFVEVMRGKGVDVAGEFSEGGCHGIDTFDDARASVFYGVVKRFVVSL